MKKILITGASGFLGYHLMRVASASFQVYGFTHTKAIEYAPATLLNCDLTNYIELGNLIDAIEPDLVIHAAAVSDANFCEQHKELSHAINVEATKNLAGICSDYDIPFAFTSTDLVFDGKQGMYSEEDVVNPLNIYGEQKATAEVETLKIYPKATIFRLPLLFGEPIASATTYIYKLISQLQKGETAMLFTDEYRSMCGAKSVSEGMLKLLELELNAPATLLGIIHLAGSERLSRYQFGLQVADAFKLNANLVQACSQKDVKMAAPRPADVSLAISKAIHLGFCPLTVNEELKLISSQNYFS